VSGSIVTPAILLRASAYGESDRVVSLLGRTTGRVAAIAKGARKSQRRFGGGLGLGAGGEATLRDRAGADLLMLEAFELGESRLGLAQDVARTAHAAYALELCDRLCAPRQPEPTVFDWLETFLREVEGRGAALGRLRAFELGLLQRLGLGAVLDRCARCERSDLGEETTRWHPAEGGVMCGTCARTGTLLPSAPRRALERLSRLPLDLAECEALDRDVNLVCRRVIQELLSPHLTSPLRSLEFIAKLGA
jgi:DNA repair protein RecO (recombination protein O)